MHPYFILRIQINSSKKVRKLKFDWRFLSCYQLIFLAFGIIGKPCYSSLQWCAICYDYAIWGCAAHLNMGVGVKWNVPKCIAIVIHSKKNSRVRFDPEKSPMGPDPFLGQTDLESGYKLPESWVQNVFLTRIPGQSDLDSGSVWPGFRVGLTPKWVWPPRTLFRVKSDPGVFRVYDNSNAFWHISLYTHPHIQVCCTSPNCVIITNGTSL